MPTKYEKFIIGDMVNPTLSVGTVFDTEWSAQTFIATSNHDISHITLMLIKNGTPATNLTVEIRDVTGVDNHPGPTVLKSGTIALSTIPNLNFPYRLGFTIDLSSALTLVSGTKYAIVLYTDVSGDASNLVYCYGPTTSGYAGGSAWQSTNSGSTWAAQPYIADFFFELWDGAPVKPTVTTQAVTNFTGTDGTGNGTIVTEGNGDSVFRDGCIWGSGTPTFNNINVNNQSINEVNDSSGIDVTGPFSVNMSNILGGYSYRAFVTNMAGFVYGNVVSFPVVYPTLPMTRVTGLIHRYNRLEGIYELEMALGDVITDFGLPQPEFVSKAASLLHQQRLAEEQAKANAEVVIEQSQEIPQAISMEEAIPQAISMEEAKKVIADITIPSGSTYFEQLQKLQATNPNIIAQARSAEPGALTSRAIGALLAPENQVKIAAIEAAQAPARLLTGNIASERTKMIIATSPEAQQRLAAAQKQQKQWWEFWK